MARYQIAWKASTRQVAIQNYGDALPATYSNIGNFYHDAAQDNLGDNPEAGHDENHVFWHHIRDELYAEGVQDMASVTIRVYPTSVLVSPDPWGAFLVGATRQAAVTFTPTNTTNQAGVWASSDATKATVSATGLVTAVAAGATNISFTSTDGSKTDLVAVTVTTP